MEINFNQTLNKFTDPRRPYLALLTLLSLAFCETHSYLKSELSQCLVLRLNGRQVTDYLS
jgi:hypothetical protein